MFPPEKISPDSLLEGKYMLDGMFVFFICSLSLHRLFLYPYPSLLCSFYDDSCSSNAFQHLISFLLFMSLRLLLISLPSLFVSVSPAAPLPPLCQCSVSCGGGVQARSIQCLRQGRPAAGCMPHQRPVTSRACNTHFCPASPLAPAQRPGRVTAAGPTPKGKFI